MDKDALSRIRTNQAIKRWQKYTPEQRSAIVDALHSPESRAKRAESLRRYYANLSEAERSAKLTPETRAKMSAAKKGVKKTPEHRAALKAAWARRKQQQKT